MKLTLGVFHFNVQYVAGDLPTYHRYCTQAIIPFLEAIAADGKYRASFEMSGSGLEFLSENYPGAIALLRDLIDRNQIELISSTYAPTLWVAFPKRDLVKSIELNQACLSKLGLKASKIFLAQEAFFGPGLEEITDWFSAAICKDDTLRLLSSSEISRPMYRLGNLLVVVGCNHILNDLAAGVIRAAQAEKPLVLSSFHQARLQEAVNSASQSAPELIDGTVGDLQWHWYHLGSGHHFSTCASPLDWTSFFFDPDWMRLNLDLLDSLIARGFRLAFITEFVEMLKQHPPSAMDVLPPMIEGSWDPKRSRGVYAWMGKQERHWENAPGLLGLVWRARHAVRECELLMTRVGDSEQRQEFGAKLEEAWKHQILAESSDPLGWAPHPVEVNFGRECAEKVINLCATLKTLILGLPQSPPSANEAEGERGFDFHLSARLSDAGAPVAAELVGAEGGITWFSASEQIQICEARFRSVESECGVRFKRSLDYVVYCPSGLEQRPARIDFQNIRQPTFYLPLANGLISLDENLHLVRINRFGQVAVRVSKSEPWLTFTIEGPAEGRNYQWRFIIVRGPIEDAVRIANGANSV